MATLFTLILLFFFPMFVGTVFIWMGAHLFRAERRSFWRAAVVMLIWQTLSLVPLSVWVLSNRGQSGGPLYFLEFVLSVFILVSVPLLVIRPILIAPTLRSFGIFVFACVAGAIVMLPLLFFAIKPYVMEAFVVPTNAMAPTITGWHRIDKCPKCAGRLVVRESDPAEGEFMQADEEVFSICHDCRTISKIPQPKRTRDPFDPGRRPQGIQDPDRIIVHKLLKPGRWDIIVFRYPPDPKTKYTSRLVGLPGEKLEIKADSLWVNGTKVEFPSSISGLKYRPSPDGMRRGGNADEPETFEKMLGEKEFFVLGDFTDLSSDSRVWGTVPGENIEGVVEVCYWPWNRMRVIR